MYCMVFIANFLFLIKLHWRWMVMGGNYHARDNVKFGFPMAVMTTMFSWSIWSLEGAWG